MATTPNYGWVMPDPTDFVTDLPADFEIFGDAVDAQVLLHQSGFLPPVVVKCCKLYKAQQQPQQILHLPL
jgi:hypothetical protein